MICLSAYICLRDLRSKLVTRHFSCAPLAHERPHYVIHLGIFSRSVPFQSLNVPHSHVWHVSDR